MTKKVHTLETEIVPDGIPVLSPGRHRRPSQGACFMEFASYLAGERWSDHPACTHPLLAFLARGVNDFTSNDGRAKLTSLIPSVIGLTSADPRLDVVIALRAAHEAIPIVSESRQRALASGVLGCEKMLLSLDGELAQSTARLIREAAEAAPLAWAWAGRFVRSVDRGSSSQTFTRQGRAIVSTAVLGVSQACIDDPDAVLVRMLRAAIRDTAAFVGAASAAPVTSEWRPGANMVAQL